MGNRIVTNRQLEVNKKAFDAGMEIYRLSKKFPKEEIYSLTDQIRRSSRSVCANLAEAWRKRRYVAAFIAKLSDAEAEAGETKSGSNLPSNVITLRKAQHSNFIAGTTRSSAPSSA